MSRSDLDAPITPVRSAKTGVLLNMSGCDDEGESVVVKWKAYEPDEVGSCMRWDFRWFLQDAGYVEVGAKKLWRHIHDNWQRWLATFSSSGLPPQTTCGISQHAMSKQIAGAQEVTSAAQEHWVTTAGLLALFADWVTFRRQRATRSRVSTLGRMFFERCVPKSDASALLNRQPEDEQLKECRQEPVYDGMCICFQRTQETIAATKYSTPQHALFMRLVALSANRACKAVRSALTVLLQDVAESIDDGAASWGAYQWHRTAAAHLTTSGNKRRRVDFHVKQFAMHTAVTEQSASTCAEVVRSLDQVDAPQGARWILQELAAYRAETCLSFRSAQVISCAFDASRIGRPAKDLVIGFITCASSCRHAVLPPQVLRDYTTVTGKEQQELTAEEQERVRRLEYLQVKKAFEQELSAQAAREEQGLEAELRLEKLLRKANRDWIRKIDNALKVGTMEGFDKFTPKRRLLPLGDGEQRSMVSVQASGGGEELRSVLTLASGQRVYELPRFIVKGKRQRPVLHLAVDQGSVGYPAVQFLMYEQGLRLTVAADLWHRLHNDLLDAISDTGLTVVRLEFLNVLRLRHGPFAAQANASILSSAACEMETLWGSDNILFQVLYDDIVMECPELQAMAGVGSQEHMDMTWKFVCQRLKRKGSTDTRTTRWWSWEQASRAACQMKSMDTLLLCFIGHRRKWWKGLGDNPLAQVRSEPPTDAGEALFGEEGGGGGAAAPTGGDGPADGPSDSRVSIAAGREEVRKRRAKCASMLHFCCNILVRPLSARLWQLLSVVALPLEEWCGLALGQIKTPRGGQELLFELHRGALDRIAIDLLHHMRSPAIAAAAGLGRAGAPAPSAYLQRQTQVVMDRAWNLKLRLAGQLLITAEMFKVPPMCFVMLVHPDVAIRSAELRRLKDVWGAMCRMEETSLHDRACCNYYRNLQVGLNQYVRETFVRLMEVGFERVPEDLAEDILQYSLGFFSSLICEQGFNKLRSYASHNRAHKMDCNAAFHVLSSASGVLETFGRPGVSVTSAARAASPGKLPKHAYDPSHGECSLPSKDLDRLMGDATWPNLSPSSQKLAMVAFKSMVAHGGDWSKLGHGVLNRLLIPGTVVLMPGQKLGKLVVCATLYGAWVYRCEVTTGNLLRLPPIVDRSLEFVTVQDVEDWRVAAVVIEEHPTHPTSNELACYPKFQGPATSLLKYAARMGFKGISVSQMKALFDFLAVPYEGVKPSTENLLLKALHQHILGIAATPAVMEAAVKLRHAVTEGSEELLTATKLFEPYMEGVAELFEEDHEVAAQLEALREERAKLARKAAARAEAVTKMTPLASSSSSSSSSTAAAGRARTFVPVVADGISQAEAQRLCPASARISKDDRRENRWRIRSKLLPSEKSKSYGAKSATTDWQAMCTLLAMAWKAHTESTGEPCPWDLECEV